MEDFQEVSDIKNKKINLTVDNKKIIIELNEDKKMYIVYNKTNCFTFIYIKTILKKIIIIFYIIVKFFYFFFYFIIFQHTLHSSL